MSRAEIPDAWLEEAWDWVKGDLGDDAEIWAGIEALDFHLPADQALAFFRQCRQSRPMTSYLVNRDAKEQVRGANGSFFKFEPNLALSGGRPNGPDPKRGYLESQRCEP